MGRQLNLAEITQKIARANIQATDAMTAKYLEEVVRHITDRGDKIEDYAMVAVNTPMQVKDRNLKVTIQYRVMPISELELLPNYGDES